MGDKIRISYEELNDPQIDELIVRQAEETAMRRGAGTIPDEMLKTKLIHKSWFYLMIAGCLGALIAWTIVEPYFNDYEPDQAKASMQGFLMFMSVGGFIGLMIGCTEGILSKNFSRSVKGGIIGFGIGFGGGLVSMIGAGIILIVVFMIGIPIGT